MFKFKDVVPEVYVALHKVKRTGWVDRNVKNPESDLEHTELLLVFLSEITHLLTDAELDGLDEMLEVHEWPEADGFDEVILELDPSIREILLNNKFKREEKIMERICEGIPSGENYLNLWLRFENSDDPAARLARQMDKYINVPKALEYELEQGISMFKDFLDYAVNFIVHPVLIDRLKQLEAKWVESKKLSIDKM